MFANNSGLHKLSGTFEFFFSGSFTLNNTFSPTLVSSTSNPFGPISSLIICIPSNDRLSIVLVGSISPSVIRS